MLTIGIQHTSGSAESRTKLASLLHSIRSRYSSVPLFVAYDGSHVYDETVPGAFDEVYFKSAPGLAAGRNQLAALTSTEFLMLVDDETLFHNASSVEMLVDHLQQDPSLALAAACYYPSACGAAHLKSDGQHVTSSPVAVHGQSAPIRAQTVQNAFVARTAVLVSAPWDERQPMEREPFFAVSSEAIERTPASIRLPRRSRSPPSDHAGQGARCLSRPLPHGCPSPFRRRSLLVATASPSTRA